MPVVGQQAVCAEVEPSASAPGASLTTKQRLARVHVVTRGEAESGKWSMQDVVLPVPGKSTLYPAHATRLVYANASRKDGISLPGLVVGDSLNAGRQPADAREGGIDEAPANHCNPEDADVKCDTIGGVTVPDVTVASRADDMLADSSVPRSVAAEFGFSSLTGDYRRVVLCPRAFEWDLMKYR